MREREEGEWESESECGCESGSDLEKGMRREKSR